MEKWTGEDIEGAQYQPFKEELWDSQHDPESHPKATLSIHLNGKN